MSGREPVETIGTVRIFEPTGTSQKGRYYRLRWTNLDGTPDGTTAGRTLEGAQWKAHEIDRLNANGAGPHAMSRLDELVEEYLAEGTSPYTGDPWQHGYRNQVEDQLRRCIRGHEHYRAMDVTRDLLDRLRAQAGTARMVTQNTTALKGFLRWGYRHTPQYFTAAQAELLPAGAVKPLPALRGTPMPRRSHRTRAVTEREGYVRTEDAPSADQVARLGRRLATRYPAWGRLAPELAANCGPRWGEQYQLTADDVHAEGCPAFRAPHFHIDWQIDPGGTAETDRRTRPKGHKTRIAPIPRLSFTGYRLLEEVIRRRDATLAEQAEGRNPEALLFPAARGGLLWHTSWETKVLLPAMAEAGWPLRAWTERRDAWSEATRSYSPIERERRMAELTWHSLRHRFARVAIDLYGCKAPQLMALGGWENEATVQNRYYRSGAEHTASGLDLFSA